MEHADMAGPFHFNDPDHLLVGRGLLNDDEEKTHFALWAVAKAPLIISANITTLPFTSEAILKNEWLIAVNQDKLGQQAKCTYNCVYNASAIADPIQAY